MNSKSLIFGITGFILGGLVVSIAATALPDANGAAGHAPDSHSLQRETGYAFDKAFLTEMIGHHEGAVDMARLAEKRARHPEIKQLSSDILESQSAEIRQMRAWQSAWGYNAAKQQHSDHSD